MQEIEPRAIGLDDVGLVDVRYLHVGVGEIAARTRSGAAWRRCRRGEGASREERESDASLGAQHCR